MASKKLLLLFSCVILVKSTTLEEIQCPQGCVCDMVQNLRAVFCVGEKLTTIEANIPDQVQFLDFSDNIISKIGDYAFKDLKMNKLVILNMSTNSLSQISLRAFEGLEHLQIVDLSYNILHSIPEDLFETNTELLKLYLAGNKFGFLDPQPILNSKSLQVLDLSNCIISHLYQETFSKLPSLTTITLNNNFLIQLTIRTFENLSQLKYLSFEGNKLVCNVDLYDFIDYLNKQQIKFENICKGVEKSQKLIIQAPVTEKSALLNWNFDNCDIDMSLNETKCEILHENNYFTVFFIALSFGCGILTGASAVCCFFNCLYVGRRRNKTLRSRRQIRQRVPRERNEYLLSETSFDIGLSTPVLSRVRHTNIIR